MSMASFGSNDATTNHLGQASLLGAAPTATECSPLFQGAIEKIAEACIPQFEKLAGENMTVTCVLTSLTTDTAGDVLAAVDPTATTALLDMPSLSSRVLVSLEDDLVQFVIELMCGGILAEPPAAAPRPGTSIDRQFARIVLNLLRGTIEKECAAFGVGKVLFGQIETKIDPLALGKRNTRVSIATLAFDCLGRRASLRLAFPQTVMDRFRQDALPANTRLSIVDPDWTERFQAEIGRAVVSLDAFLSADSLTLGDVATLKIGQILSLPKAAPSNCELRCDEKLLFRCELGQAEGRYSLRIEETLPRQPAAKTAPPVVEPSPLFDLSL